MRLKGVRHPDVVCLEVVEQFLRDADQAGIKVRLAGAQPDFLAAIARLRFAEWYPPDRIFPELDDRDSATLRAVRRTYAELDATDEAAHRPQTADLYYLV